MQDIHKCIPLHKEGWYPDDPEADQVYATLLDTIPAHSAQTFLYRLCDGGNLFPLPDIEKALEGRRDGVMSSPGTIQVKSGGVPEVVLSGDAVPNYEKICEALLERGIVPNGTPLWTCEDGLLTDRGYVGMAASSMKM